MEKYTTTFREDPNDSDIEVKFIIDLRRIREAIQSQYTIKNS